MDMFVPMSAPSSLSSPSSQSMDNQLQRQQQQQQQQLFGAPKKFDALASNFARQRRHPNVVAGMSAMASKMIPFEQEDSCAATNNNASNNNSSGIAPSLVSDLDRVLDILDSAEDIVSAATASQEAHYTPGHDWLEPTPLGPQGVQVVPFMKRASISMTMEQQRDDLLDVLNPLLMLTPPPQAKRQRVEHASSSPTSVLSSMNPAMNNMNRNMNMSMNMMPNKITSSGSEAPTTTSTTPTNPSLAPDAPDEERFRPYQSDQWKDRFQDLKDFCDKNGHCLVPHNFPENQQLAQWIKRQRYQYKLKQLNRHSTLTDERQGQLEQMGFVWDSHKAAWIERFESLKQFQQTHGHCSVPSNYVDRSLAIWVKCQRRQFKLFQQGSRSTMNQERFNQLELLGFDWNPRNL